VPFISFSPSGRLRVLSDPQPPGKRRLTGQVSSEFGGSPLANSSVVHRLRGWRDDEDSPDRFRGRYGANLSAPASGSLRCLLGVQTLAPSYSGGYGDRVCSEGHINPSRSSTFAKLRQRHGHVNEGLRLTSA